MVDYGLSCYLFDHTGASDGSSFSGGYMCDPEVEYTIDLIMSDPYYQAVSYYN